MFRRDDRVKGWGFSFKTPPPTLNLLYQDVPVAALERTRGGVLVFRYLPAFAQLNLSPLPGFPRLEEEYYSAVLWPYFAERIPDLRRPEIARWVKLKKLDVNDELQLLAELGAHTVTDPFVIQRAA